MKSRNCWTKRALMLATVALCLLLIVSIKAQVQTSTTTTSGQSRKVVQVDRGEVVAVEGNDLIVKMEDGSIRHFPNIPESARISVGGRFLGIHDLTPGMKLERTITTTTTPQTVTTVQTVKGTVWHVTPPISVILTLEDGTNQSFKIPKDQKFNVDGKMIDAFGLRKGMKITATKIVEVPTTVTAQQRSVTGTMPAPPPADVPILIAEENPNAAPATPAEAAPAEPAPAPVSTNATEPPAAPAETHAVSGNYPLLIGLLVLLILIVWLVARSVRSKPRP